MFRLVPLHGLATCRESGLIMVYFHPCHHCGHVEQVTEDAYGKGKRLQGGGMICADCERKLNDQGVKIRWAAKINIRP
jgi:hypothetical protein